MFLWPLIAMGALFFQERDSKTIQTNQPRYTYSVRFIRYLASKWILSFTLFRVFFTLFAKLSGTKLGHFDPSGHLTCGLLVSGLWLQIYLFVIYSCADFYAPNSPLVKWATYAVLGAIGYHAYGVFYTVLAYHDFFENVIGMGFGLVIYCCVFLNDVFSDSIHEIIMNLIFRDVST